MKKSIFDGDKWFTDGKYRFYMSLPAIVSFSMSLKKKRGMSKRDRKKMSIAAIRKNRKKLYLSGGRLVTDSRWVCRLPGR